MTRYLVIGAGGLGGPIALALAARPGTVLRYETSLKLRRKPHDLVVAVYDLASGAILSSALEVEP